MRRMVLHCAPAGAERAGNFEKGSLHRPRQSNNFRGAWQAGCILKTIGPFMQMRRIGVNDMIGKEQVGIDPVWPGGAGWQQEGSG